MKVLVVVDMLNAFAHKDGALFFPDAEKIIPFVAAKVDEYLKKGWHVIFLSDNHAYNDKEFERFPRHAVSNSWEAQIINELKFALSKPGVFVVPKTRYSGFYKTNLDEILMRKGLDHEANLFEFVGVCTGICDTDTIGDFANRDMKTAIYKDGVADLPNVAYGIEDCNMSMNDIMLARMAFVYGTKIL